MRLQAVRELSSAGIPAGLLMGPVIPGLNDHEMPAIIQAAVSAGASFAGYVPLRLPHGLKELFETWLAQHFPERRDKVLNGIRAMRGGKMYDATFGSRMRGEGILADQMEKIFEISCRKAGLKEDARPELSTAAFRRPHAPDGQLNLF
jgi:DNA repair photolyase